MALTEKLTAIGDAIREKTGGTDLIPLANMPEEIRGIETGGGGMETPNNWIEINELGLHIPRHKFDSELEAWEDSAKRNPCMMNFPIVSIPPLDPTRPTESSWLDFYYYLRIWGDNPGIIALKGAGNSQKYYLAFGRFEDDDSWTTSNFIYNGETIGTDSTVYLQITRNDVKDGFYYNGNGYFDCILRISANATGGLGNSAVSDNISILEAHVPNSGRQGTYSGALWTGGTTFNNTLHFPPIERIASYFAGASSPTQLVNNVYSMPALYNKSCRIVDGVVYSHSPAYYGTVEHLKYKALLYDGSYPIDCYPYVVDINGSSSHRFNNYYVATMLRQKKATIRIRYDQWPTTQVVEAVNVGIDYIPGYMILIRSDSDTKSVGWNASSMTIDGNQYSYTKIDVETAINILASLPPYKSGSYRPIYTFTQTATNTLRTMFPGAKYYELISHLTQTLNHSVAVKEVSIA